MEKLTFEKLPEAVTLLLEKVDRIEYLLQHSAPPKQEPVQSEILNLRNASTFLELSVSSLYKRTMNREIPFYKVGSRIYFKRAELLDWVFANRVKTMDEINSEAALHLANLANKRRHRY